MRKIVVAKGGPLLSYIDRKIFTEDHFPPDTVCIGIIDDEEKKILGVCAFTDYRGSTINMHIAGEGSDWNTREFTCRCFMFAFNELKVNTVIGLVRPDNRKAMNFDMHLGFRVTGTIPKGDDDGSDFYLLTMTKEQCRWLKEKDNG